MSSSRNGDGGSEGAQGLEKQRWWDGDSAESYWMEITDRSDLGVDLKAPQRDDSGAEKWTYALVREVSPGDVVLHWSTPARAIVG